MNKLLIPLLLFYVNAYATKWVKVVDVEEAIYIDAKSIKKNGVFVFYTSLANTPLMGVNSVIVRNKVDCEKEKVIELNVAYYGQPMGRGTPVKEEKNINNEVFPEPLTNTHNTMKFACDYLK